MAGAEDAISVETASSRGRGSSSLLRQLPRLCISSSDQIRELNGGDGVEPVVAPAGLSVAGVLWFPRLFAACTRRSAVLPLPWRLPGVRREIEDAMSTMSLLRCLSGSKCSQLICASRSKVSSAAFVLEPCLLIPRESMKAPASTSDRRVLFGILKSSCFLSSARKCDWGKIYQRKAAPAADK